MSPRCAGLMMRKHRRSSCWLTTVRADALGLNLLSYHTRKARVGKRHDVRGGYGRGRNT
ncbi:hypothetical protein HETIRDRAFT_141426 [Heterobasidion irregulare TC 32-1]|uniref:Uncharacterized protein n=1 Tax=Heterobasidion irregulare (strain TC 32-1) TaxID=747525 RepID=W4KJJ8_HETIT|nr:uncharacterized protein HETIRDRAFT_141426 [Heterobasidion irregulare TC 32-1]ETW85490.1 hypothetical protein HETIRDRAFT_141426 [Heterobasidion irregulare TC 32-1]